MQSSSNAVPIFINKKNNDEKGRCLKSREQHDQWRQLCRQQEDDLPQMISGTHHQLGIVEVTNECQAINQTYTSFLAVLRGSGVQW